MGYLNCKIYQLAVNGKEPIFKRPEDQALADTAKISVSKIHPNNASDNSSEDVSNDGNRQYHSVSRWR